MSAAESAEFLIREPRPHLDGGQPDSPPDSPSIAKGDAIGYAFAIVSGCAFLSGFPCLKPDCLGPTVLEPEGER